MDSILKRLAVLILLSAVIVFSAGCEAQAKAILPAPSVAADNTEVFGSVTGDGVVVDSPENWSAITDPALIYGVSKSEYIRITVAVLPAQPQDYYASLVSQGTVNQTMLNGKQEYQNDYVYPYNGHQMVSRCVTIVNGSTACHVMILCDTELLTFYAPVFQHIINSVEFLPAAS
jgi:hypothetical protein